MTDKSLLKLLYRIREYFQKITSGVRRTFFLIILLAVVIPFLLISIVMFIQIQSEIYENYLNESKHTLSSAALYLNNYFGNIDKQGIDLYADKYLIGELRGNSMFATEREGRDYVESHLIRVCQSQDDVEAVLYKAVNRDYEVCAGNIGPVSNTRICDFRDIPSEKCFYIPDNFSVFDNQFEFYMIGDGENERLVYTRAVYNFGHNAPIGYFSIIIKPDKLRSDTNSFSTSDKELMIIYSNAQNEFFLLPDKIQADEIRRSITKSEEYNDSEYYLFQHNIDDYGISVCKLTPRAYTTINVDSKAIVVAAMYTFVVAVALILTASLSKTITKPIKKLQDAIYQLQSTHSGVIVPTDGEKNEITEAIDTFNQMAEEMDRLINEQLIATISMQDMQLKILQTTINPHFISNTLQPIGDMALKYNAYDVKYMLDAFCGIMRYSLRSNEEFASISEEIEHLRKYLILQKMRLGDSLDYTIDYNTEAGSFLLPRMTIQPLVENAICYGYSDEIIAIKVNVKAYVNAEGLKLTITDNGAGFKCDPEQLLSHLSDKKQPIKGRSTGIGLINVDSRMRMIFKDRYSMSIMSVPAERTCICITVLPESKSFKEEQ